MAGMKDGRKEEAKELFINGMKLSDIARKLDVPEGTVRSWKNRGKWSADLPEGFECGTAEKNRKDATLQNSVAKNGKRNATLQKRKRGGQKGNKNAMGNKGNPSPNPPPDATKHGAYRAVFMDVLDEDERELVEMIPEDEERLLVEQIQLFSIRERRIMMAINKYRGQKADVSVSDIYQSETKRLFKDDNEKRSYEERIRKKVKNGDRLPGESCSVQTHTTNKDLISARLEQELSSVQGKKTKAIEALAKIRTERRKMEEEASASELADDWIAAVIGGALDGC